MIFTDVYYFVNTPIKREFIFCTKDKYSEVKIPYIIAVDLSARYSNSIKEKHLFDYIRVSIRWSNHKESMHTYYISEVDEFDDIITLKIKTI